MSRMVKRQERGITLFEILIVLSIISIVASISIFGIQNLLPQYRLRSEANEMITDFRKVQQLAISKQMRYGIRFDSDSNKYTIFNEKDDDIETKELANGIEYAADEIAFAVGTDWELEFDAMGTTENGHVTLINNNQQKYKISTYWTGKISLEKVE